MTVTSNLISPNLPQYYYSLSNELIQERCKNGLCSKVVHDVVKNDANVSIKCSKLLIDHYLQLPNMTAAQGPFYPRR